MPVTKNSALKLGIICPLPEDIYSALALNLGHQIARILQELGHHAWLMDPLGNPLSPEPQEQPPARFDLALYLDYRLPKLLDTLSFLVDWHPIRHLAFDPASGQPRKAEELGFIRQATLSHDLLLQGPSPAPENFHRARFGDTFWAPMASNPALHPSCRIFEEVTPARPDMLSACLMAIPPEPPQEAKYYLEVADTLAASGHLNIYPFFGKANEAPTSNTSPLPDDDQSIVDTFNRHGIALFLADTAFQESALPPPLFFHACAAHCVILCPENSFIEENFKDSVLTYSPQPSPKDTAQVIRSLLSHVRQHPEEWSTKAKTAHRIFRENFALDTSIQRFLNALETIRRQSANRYARLAHKSVEAIFLCRPNQEEHLEAFFSQLSIARHIKVHGLVLISADDFHSAQERSRPLIEKLDVDCTLIPVEGLAYKPDGALIHLAMAEYANGTFFAHWRPGIRWHSEHLAKLALEILNTGNLAAQSRVSIHNSWFSRSREAMEVIRYSCTATRRIDARSFLSLDDSKVEFSSFLYHSSLLYQNWPFMSLLNYLDSQYPFLLILEHLKKTGRLPGVVPAFTTQYRMNTEHEYQAKRPRPDHFQTLRPERREAFTRPQQHAFIRQACQDSSDHDQLLSLFCSAQVYPASPPEKDKLLSFLSRLSHRS